MNFKVNSSSQKSVKIENREIALEVISSIQAHYKLHEKVSHTVLHKNKPLGALIYASKLLMSLPQEPKMYSKWILSILKMDSFLSIVLGQKKFWGEMVEIFPFLDSLKVVKLNYEKNFRQENFFYENHCISPSHRAQQFS